MSEKQMTKADAAKLVRREAVKMKDKKPVLGKDGNPEMEYLTVTEDEVMSFKDYGAYVVVVTTDGKKLRGDKK